MNHTDIIKDKLNIVDVVSSYVKLEKSGSTYKGKSPFTNEKTPSFFVHPDKGFFYCFSSQQGGDIFTFIQKIERVEFQDALRMLAERAGVTLDKASFQTQNKNKKLYELLEENTKLFQDQLKRNVQAQTYLKERGLNQEMINAFRIGFAPDEWQFSYNHLITKGFSAADIESTGMIIKKEGTGRYYDRFRSRIMFPLFDPQGRVIGFSGRLFEKDTGPKYLNSPESPLFDKSRYLYGYHSAKKMMAQKDQAVLVEGQFDVVLAHQIDVAETVAISGTGLTDQHLDMIGRFTKQLVFSLDSDPAGIKATRRSILKAYAKGFSVRVALLPEGEDPADMIVKNPERFRVTLLDAEDYVEYRMSIAEKQTSDYIERKKIVDEDIFECISLQKSAIDQDKALQKVALFLGVSVAAVRGDFEAFVAGQKQENFVKDDTPEENTISDHDTDHKTPLLTKYFYLKEKEKLDDKDDREFVSRYVRLFDQEPASDWAQISQEQKNMHSFVIEDQYKDNASHVLRDIFDVSRMLLLRKLENLSRGVLQKIRQAEGASDDDLLLSLLKENSELRKEIESLKEQIR
jgi:DNA primase